jgi:hypothetical protein
MVMVMVALARSARNSPHQETAQKCLVASQEGQRALGRHLVNR